MAERRRFYDRRPIGPDDRRLVRAGVPVFFVFALIFGHLFSPGLLPTLSEPAALTAGKTPKERLYRVLLEQDYRPAPVEQQIRALSDVTAAGTGYLTERSGFHTLSQFDRLDPGKNQKTSERQDQQTKQRNETAEHGATYSASKQSTQKRGSMFKIPSNYRFRNDFALRYDGSQKLSIAREKLAGFKYFQKMLQQIRENFAPPGFNYAYRDQSGLVVNQHIKPQVVKVLFLLDKTGAVRDVRRVASMGQHAVDLACINALAGQNFGPPPLEIFAEGNVFGINFIFPKVGP